MNIHEYQAKQILAKFGIPLIPWEIVHSSEEAEQAFIRINKPLVVIKAQVHAGGRGKGGGVKLVRTPEEAREKATRMLEAPLITPQTGSAGVPVTKLLIAEAVDMAHEYYIGITLDRTLGLPMYIACAEGGINIEEVAQNTPEKIIKIAFDPTDGLYPFQARRLASLLGFVGKHMETASQLFVNLSHIYLTYDCSILEINPLITTPSEQIIALDAKISLEDNAAFRHATLYEELCDHAETPPSEIRAKKANISYISLDGNIGCMVNGAGLAMATMDIIQHAGGMPANFLDVGGSVKQEQVTEAFDIILSDSRVKTILVNIFGGIVHCDIIAQGILAAVEQMEVKVPLVVCLEGTNKAQGQALLENSKLSIAIATSMKEAAEKSVCLANV